MTSNVLLRAVLADDLAVFSAQQMDPIAQHMAAFTREDLTDQAGLIAHWTKLLADEAITARTILVDRQVIGHIASFDRLGTREVTYWIGRVHWGKGIASRALVAFLRLESSRPLAARVAFDNLASRRVLEKSGFVPCGREVGYANARGKEIEEVVFCLTAASVRSIRKR